MTTRKYVIYSDGSSSKNGTPDARGGWASVIVDSEGNETEITGFQAGATNNQMELKGVIEAFRLIPENSLVKVVTDSEYVINGASKWIRGWIKKGFKNIKNVPLWQELIQVTKTHRIMWEWVKGHAGHPYNERCDRLAVAARS